MKAIQTESYSGWEALVSEAELDHVEQSHVSEHRTALGVGAEAMAVPGP